MEYIDQTDDFLLERAAETKQVENPDHVSWKMLRTKEDVENVDKPNYVSSISYQDSRKFHWSKLC